MNQQRIIRIRRISQVALLSALALVLSYLETMIPLPVAVPGIKLGLANVAVLVALYLCDVRSATLVMLIKVLASGFLFGSPLMLAYSAGGTLLAFAGMLVCRALPWVDLVPTSMIAAILHNVGQLAVAAFFLSTTAVFLTLPMLAFAACITGLLTGLVANGVIAAVPAPSARPYRFDQEESVTKAGEITAIVGRNGSGKTTLALKMAGLLPGDCEEATELLSGDREETVGLPPSNLSAEKRKPQSEPTTPGERAFTGIAFQNPDNQIVASTVEDDCAFGLENRGVSYSNMHAIVDETLDTQGILELAKRQVNELSGGEKQKLAAAGLIAMSPGALVFDESAAMLNPAARDGFWAQCRALANEGKAVAVITHSMEDAFTCDRLAIVDEGSIIWQGEPKAIVDNKPANDTQQAFSKLEEAIAQAGLELPLALKVSRQANDAGLKLPYCLNEEDLVEALSSALADVPGLADASIATSRMQGGRPCNSSHASNPCNVTASRMQGGRL